MATHEAIQAALNNAVWCDTICQAHGLPTSFSADAWMSRSPAPPLYPNLVTLSPGDVDSQMRGVTELRSSFEDPGWAVKDSFNVLDLVPEGFQPMFDAVWVHRAAGEEVVPSDLGLVVLKVGSPERLLAWEAAWRGTDGAAPSPSPRLFPAVLLEDADVAFLAVTDGPDLVGGVIANRAAEAVGITNMFCRRGPERRLAAVCISAASALCRPSPRWPTRPARSCPPFTASAFVTRAN